LPLVPEEAARGGPMEVRISVSQPCSACQGRGDAGGGSCALCGGQGTIWQSRLLQLRLPPGLRDGIVLCIPGYGKAAGPHAPSGDLYLRVRVRPCW
jgi:molecular chaperone DnaJ